MKTRAQIEEMFEDFELTEQEVRAERIRQKLDRAWFYIRNSPKYIAAVALAVAAFYTLAAMAGVLNDG